MHRRLLTSLILATSLSALLAPPALAKDSAEAARLRENRKIEKYKARMAGHSSLAGAARAHFKVPARIAAGYATRFHRYKSMIPKFDQARVVGRDKAKGTVDVYLKVPILHGASHIWGIIRFEKPRKVGSDYVIEGKMVKGNVRTFDARYVIEDIDGKSSILKLEMLVELKMPFAQSLVTRQTAGAASNAVKHLRRTAERR